MTQMEKQSFKIETLDIEYDLLTNDDEKLIQLNEGDFNKLFAHIQALETQVEALQEALIKELKKQALIKNILNNG